MDFEWDEAKNKANVEKHGVGFQTASLIFEGPVVSIEDGRFDYGEKRINSIGMVGDATVIVVTHTDRSGILRIISARPAKRMERKYYEEAIRQRTDT